MNKEDKIIRTSKDGWKNLFAFIKKLPKSKVDSYVIWQPEELEIIDLPSLKGK